MENIKTNTINNTNEENSTGTENKANNKANKANANNKLNNENFGYTIYMMVGSNYKKASCNNPFLEQRLRAQYWDMKEEKQLQMEDVVLSYMENVLKNEIPDSFWATSATVRFTTGGSTEDAKVWFFAGNNILCIEGKFRGKNSTLTHQIFGKQKLA